MKKLLQTFAILLPLLAFSQSWLFTTDNGNWTKKGSGQYVVDPPGTVSGYLQLRVTGTTATNNFCVLENLVDNITAPVTNYKFLRVKFINNTPATTITFRADATNPSGANKSATMVANSTAPQEVFIDLTGIIWPGIAPSTSTATPGSAGSYELRFQKATADVWATTQYISVDEIEFMTDIIKNDHTFDTLDNWLGEVNATNNSTVAVAGGKLTVTPGGALNAKAKNDYYSVDASKKFIHIQYKNNSANNNTLRVNYFSPNDSYAAVKSLPDQTIVTNGAFGEVLIDASSIADWTGTVRKLSIILTNFDGTVLNPANVDTGTFEIDRVVINDTNAFLSVNDNNFNNKSELVIYPNPVSDVLNFKTPSKVKEISIYNMNGQKIRNTTSNNGQVIVSDLKTGVYIFKIRLENGTESATKFIKK